MELSSKAKKKLRAAAHSIKPSIIIGKEGASSSIDSIDKILDIKELIKIKFNSYKTYQNINLVIHILVQQIIYLSI